MSVRANLCARRHHWFRYRQIADVLTRYGFVMIVDSLGLNPVHWPFSSKRASAQPATGWSERIRQALIELGPTYIKLGQLASTRSDVLPPALVQALATLQDEVEPVKFEEIRDVVERTWKLPIHEAIARFERSPLATASIGQVHAGKLSDGRAIVIKVRRPGIVRQSRADFEILRDLAQLAERHTEWGKQYNVSRLIDDLILTLTEELDFKVEAANTERARENLKRNPHAVVPRVIWPLSAEEVLVLERLEGIKITDRERLLASGLDPEETAKRFIACLYQQIFEDGFFHADPHPGNVHVDAEGRLIWLDWGLSGTLAEEMKRRSVNLIMGMTQQRSDKVAKALIDLSNAPHEVDEAELAIQVETLRHRYYDTPLEKFQVGRALLDLFSVAQRFRIRIPSEYTLLAKAAVLADGLVRQLDPGLSLVELSKPFATRMLLRQFDPRVWAKAFTNEAGEWNDLLRSLPEDIAGALKTLRRGEIHIVMEHKNIDMILSQWEKFINRIGLSFLLGAIILGSALVVHHHALDRLFHFQVGEYGFMISVLLAMVVVLHAVRKGKL